MLSPSMMTRSNAHTSCAFSICLAISYCGRSPVPLSPMAANFSESVRLGKEREGCPKTAADVSTAKRTAIARRLPARDIVVILGRGHGPPTDGTVGHACDLRLWIGQHSRGGTQPCQSHGVVPGWKSQLSRGVVRREVHR